MQERLQKILARGGVSSRRAAEKLILEGRVRVNGKVVTELGTKADPVRDKVEVGAVRVQREDFVYYVLHKPRGVVSTLSDPESRPTIKDLLPRGGERLYPVGRLDFHTSGALLLTNDGDFANGLLHPKKDVPKTYVVKVQGEMKERDLDRWRNGVVLEDGKTKPAKVSLIRYEAGKTWFEVTITEGRNQQVRRMGEATGFPVMRLARMDFAGISAEGLAPGHCRMLTRDELKAMKKAYDVPKRISAEHPLRTEVLRPNRGRPTKETREPREAREPREGRASATRARGDGPPRHREERDVKPARGFRKTHGPSARGAREEHAPRGNRPVRNEGGRGRREAPSAAHAAEKRGSEERGGRGPRKPSHERSGGSASRPARPDSRRRRSH